MRVNNPCTQLLHLQVRLETQAFDAEQDLSAKLTELNKHYPPTVMRQKVGASGPCALQRLRGGAAAEAEGGRPGGAPNQLALRQKR